MVVVLLLAAVVGTGLAVAGGVALASRGLFDAAVTFGLTAGVLGAVVVSRSGRQVSKAPLSGEETASEPPPFFGEWFRGLGPAGQVRFCTAVAGIVAILCVGALARLTPVPPVPAEVLLAVALCLAAAALSAVAASYFAGIDPARLAEASGLGRGARVLAWLLVLSALSIGLEPAGPQALLEAVRFAVLAVDLAGCYGLLVTIRTGELDLPVLSLLGGRPNVIASILDTARRQLGIDLRSTWALTIVRRGLEPLLIGLAFTAWLSTSLTVVGISEQGLLERLGVPVAADPLAAGLHLHLPWPIDRVIRINVQKVQTVEVGHEGQEAAGAANMLWAVQHAANEYTLVLGNGRDLVTVDAAVQFRITDARAWHYHCQDSPEALKAIAYRAVMRATVDRTLAEVLSENLVALTRHLHATVQTEADKMGLGVEVVDLTLGGLHPPVLVAAAYQAVVSAEVGRGTARVNAQAYRNQLVPGTEAAVTAGLNQATAEGVLALGRANGEAFGFRALESRYRASPGEFLFRLRLEALERGLAGRQFSVVDSRIERDGGMLWLTK